MHAYTHTRIYPPPPPPFLLVSLTHTLPPSHRTQSEIALNEEVKSRLLDTRQQYVNHVKAEVDWRAHFEDKVS